jgi:hypothetical protein
VGTPPLAGVHVQSSEPRASSSQKARTSHFEHSFTALVRFEIFSEDEGRGLGFERGFLHVNSLKGT